MYMFFWFFKQLYYCLRRIFKSGILLLIVFFIAFLFIFVKPCFASSTINGFSYNDNYYTFNEPITINNNNGSYIIFSNSSFTEFKVVEPYNIDGFLVAYNTPTNLDYANNRATTLTTVRSFYNNSLSDVIIHTYNGSSWTTTNSSSLNFKFKDTTQNLIPCNVVNVNTYLSNKGMITKNNLPAGIKFTDNILIMQRQNGQTFLLYTPNSDNYFYFTTSGSDFYCKTSSGSTARFDIYTFNDSENKFILLQSNKTSYSTGISSTSYYRYTTNRIYYSNNFFNIGFGNFFDYYYREPFIVNNTTSIENWSFDNLTINCGFIDPNSSFYLHCDYEGYTFTYDNLEQYTSINNGQAIINIPKSLLNQSIVLRNGFNFSFGLQANQPNLQVLYYELGSYTMNLTSEQEEQINEDSNKQVLSDISNNQKETTQAVENLEDTITNSNIEDSSVYLPSDNTNDITQEGLNGIFTSIYNAFCVGEPQDIVFPIPFTNKNITLQPNYVRNMLTSSGATWIITIIEAFWWYLISRFIIKDITSKITKIKSGNIESIENTNIKGDML